MYLRVILFSVVVTVGGCKHRQAPMMPASHVTSSDASVTSSQAELSQATRSVLAEAGLNSLVIEYLTRSLVKDLTPAEEAEFHTKVQQLDKAMKDKIISKYLPPLLFGMYLESSIPPDEDVGIYLSNRLQSLINTLAMQDLGDCQVSWNIAVTGPEQGDINPITNRPFCGRSQYGSQNPSNCDNPEDLMLDKLIFTSTGSQSACIANAVPTYLFDPVLADQQRRRSFSHIFPTNVAGIKAELAHICVCITPSLLNLSPQAGTGTP